MTVSVRTCVGVQNGTEQNTMLTSIASFSEHLRLFKISAQRLAIVLQMLFCGIILAPVFVGNCPTSVQRCAPFSRGYPPWRYDQIYPK